MEGETGGSDVVGEAAVTSEQRRDNFLRGANKPEKRESLRKATIMEMFVIVAALLINGHVNERGGML